MILNFFNEYGIFETHSSFSRDFVRTSVNAALVDENVNAVLLFLVVRIDWLTATIEDSHGAKESILSYVNFATTTKPLIIFVHMTPRNEGNLNTNVERQFLSRIFSSRENVYLHYVMSRGNTTQLVACIFQWRLIIFIFYFLDTKICSPIFLTLSLSLSFEYEPWEYCAARVIDHMRRNPNRREKHFIFHNMQSHFFICQTLRNDHIDFSSASA